MAPDRAQDNSYFPLPARIDKILVENSMIKTFILSFVDQEYNESFSYLPGQFMMVSIPHCGEAPISFSSTPTRPGNIHLSVRRAGKLTNAMHELGVGDIVGLRGPYGTSFPVEQLQGRDLLFVAGGIGLAPLLSVINYCLDQQDEFSGKKMIVYGSRSPEEISFREERQIWEARSDIRCTLTVDKGGPGWDGHVGLVTEFLDDLDIDVKRGIAMVCGPPLMIRFVLAKLSRAGFKEKNIITTLERHMKCGVGVCRHCHMDDKLVCVDGPVFSHADLMKMDIMELRP